MDYLWDHVLFVVYFLVTLDCQAYLDHLGSPVTLDCLTRFITLFALVLLVFYMHQPQE